MINVLFFFLFLLVFSFLFPDDASLVMVQTNFDWPCVILWSERTQLEIVWRRSRGAAVIAGIDF